MARRTAPAQRARDPELLDDNVAGHAEQPVQRLRALQSIGARLQRQELDVFDLAGSEAEAAADCSASVAAPPV
jgi:hypothetical protein